MHVQDFSAKIRKCKTDIHMLRLVVWGGRGGGVAFFLVFGGGFFEDETNASVMKTTLFASQL